MARSENAVPTTRDDVRQAVMFGMSLTWLGAIVYSGLGLGILLVGIELFIWGLVDRIFNEISSPPKE
jgi:hypothetical protein